MYTIGSPIFLNTLAGDFLGSRCSQLLGLASLQYLLNSKYLGKAMAGEKIRCNICQRELDNPNDALSMDCGGDCLQCMADAGDPDCMAAVQAIKNLNQ